MRMEPAKEPEPEELTEPEDDQRDDVDEADDDGCSDEISRCYEISMGALKTVEAEADKGGYSDCNDYENEVKADLLDDSAVQPAPTEDDIEEASDGLTQPSWCLQAGDANVGEDSSTMTSPRTPALTARWRWWRQRQTVGEPGGDDKVVGEGSGSTETASTDLPLETLNSQRWAVVDREGVVVAEDDGSPLTTSSVEAKIEQLLTWMLAPAVHGIPKLGVLSAVDRANELLASAVPGRDVEAAVREVVAGSERTVSLLVANFCLERIPFLGCPSVLLKNTWGNLRSILIIAALYGHDLEKPRTHHEALLCLVPPGEDCGPRRRRIPAATIFAGFVDAGSSKTAGSPVVSETSQKVARMMIKGALRRATGFQAAVDCFELASLLYSNCTHESIDEDGYVCVVATPASTAQKFFRRKSLASCALLWFSLPMLLIGIAAPGLFNVAKLAPRAGAAFQEVSRFPRWIPAMLMALPGLLIALHTLSCAGGQRFRKWSPMRLWWRLARGREAQMLQDAWPQIVTMSVFTLHAVLPAISTFSAVTMVMQSASMALGRPFPGWDQLHGVACLTLGLYSLCTCVTNHLKDEKSEALYGDKASRHVRAIFGFFRVAWAVTRACCILAAWTYALLAIDLAATYAESRMAFASSGSEGQQTSPLGIIGPMAWLLHAPSNVNPLWSEKALTFSLRIVSVGCQQRLIALLGRREVLLRLIGADRITAHTITLLLKGVAIACSPSASANPIAEFFDAVTPPPMCCVLVVAVRAQAIVLGSTLAIAPKVISSGGLGSGTSFACGLLGGVYIARAVLQVWYENQEELYSSPLRLALLVPGTVSGKAKDLLSGAIAGARKRAVQMMAMGIIQRFIRWCFQPRAALTM